MKVRLLEARLTKDVDKLLTVEGSETEMRHLERRLKCLQKERNELALFASEMRFAENNVEHFLQFLVLLYIIYVSYLTYNSVQNKYLPRKVSRKWLSRLKKQLLICEYL